MPAKKASKYPVLSREQANAMLDHILACLADFQAGHEKMKEMAKVSDELWITQNVRYFTHCMAASNYILDKMRIKGGKE
ncbi:hypothetical protein EBT25_15545 [bacterium]|jgi:hypothetical protein|nr:hypothetical protein [bacterium]